MWSGAGQPAYPALQLGDEMLMVEWNDGVEEDLVGLGFKNRWRL
jgi:hypothetical protein